MTPEEKEEQRRILLERQQFIINFDPDKLAIPEHVQNFIDKLLREIDQYGYAIWRDNLYDPPRTLPAPDRGMFFSAYKYLEVLNGFNNNPAKESSSINSEQRDPRRHAFRNKCILQIG